MAADLLRERFGATNVILFGSLAHGLWYSEISDIDLACEGLGSEAYLLAVARLQDISDEFTVDLVSLESCRPGLREAILKEGLQL
jgi:predicted nucleotidyltransferase